MCLIHAGVLTNVDERAKESSSGSDGDYSMGLAFAV
jgi:hypothetical protein